MKISVNIEAGALAAMPLNGGRIAVDMDGIELSQLVDAVNTHGTLLRIADQTGQIVVEDSLPFGTRLNGLCCSTAHITAVDNTRLEQLSKTGHGQWILDTGYGYLLRLNARRHPALRLKQLGLSKACRRLVVTLTRYHHIDILHLDADGDTLPGVDTFDW
ncbi:hypothetical protein EIC82_03655 [Enterobacter sp. A11]|uniref:DUF5983 family protein n=1 Tax=unclassified Enterobacter TaxID=2608935 RepID=UPI00107003C5|nr:MULTISPECIES: DUF5983 family protein [unclassified Enterobacter]MBM1020258.1 hypothetical protein [Enterobacter sp. E1]MEA3561559.1 DUF5983 family protein [Enterobacter sp. GM-22]MEA3595145.1 DUF5983 family protein [Enterobacter sp. GM-31]TFF60286.1 hypothetical protein EIC82_03655 [Enterobacter sp. A11]